MMLGLLASVVAADAASSVDLRRARSKTPAEAFKGEGHAGMVTQLNRQLESTPGLKTKVCSEFGVDDIVNIQKSMLSKMDATLNDIYVESDDNRRLMVFGRETADPNTILALWQEEAALLKEHPSLHDVARDGKCHETVMWWVHHLSTTSRSELLGNMTLPLLQTTLHSRAPFWDLAPKPVVNKVMDNYKAGIGCSACHATASSGNTEATVWPSEVKYTATGHGAFPFWDNTGPGCQYCDPSVSNSAAVEVHYSDSLRSELLMHASCGDMSWTGSAKAPKNSPCNHIFTPDQGAFIYTPTSALNTEADGEFCCRTYGAGDSQFPGAVPKNWMRSMSYGGVQSGYVGDHYSGDIKVYTSTISPGLSFWYFESADGKPVDQGEGCYQPGASTKKACGYMMPIMVWHEFDQFEEASWSATDFEVPAVCKSTTISCTAPGGERLFSV